VEEKDEGGLLKLEEKIGPREQLAQLAVSLWKKPSKAPKTWIGINAHLAVRTLLNRPAPCPPGILKASDCNIWGSVGISTYSCKYRVCDLIGSCVIPINTLGKHKLAGSGGLFC
jgi:hypothetical protein